MGEHLQGVLAQVEHAGVFGLAWSRYPPTLRRVVTPAPLGKGSRILVRENGQQGEGVNDGLVGGRVDLEPMIRGVCLKPDLKIDG